MCECWSTNLHDILQPGKEHAKGMGALLILMDQLQITKMISDIVWATRIDLGAQNKFVNVIVDQTHLIHVDEFYTQNPLPGVPTFGGFCV